MKQRKGGRDDVDLDRLTDSMMDGAILFLGAAVVGIALHLALRGSGLRWTWALPVAMLGPAAAALNLNVGLAVGVCGASAAAIGYAWRRAALERGGEEAQRERSRPGLTALLVERHRLRRARLNRVRADRLALGESRLRRLRTIPFGSLQGVRGLIVGAPGSGKTITTGAIASAYISEGLPVVCIDPKGDPGLHSQLERAADRAGVTFCEWSHQGPSVYNPFARGDATEIADKALAGEMWTEPHYLRQGQRYLGWAIRALRSAKISFGLPGIARYMDPARLEALSDRCEENVAVELRAYLDSLSPRQRSDLGGVRDRLAVLAESELGKWLDPETGGQQIELAKAWSSGSVLYFRLDADRYPLASEMLGAALVSDLVSLTGELQGSEARGLVAIDEFAAIGARNVLRVLSRSRSAGISVALATQGIADLEDIASEGAPESFAKRLLTQLDFVIAHRQPEPDTAEALSRLAGTRPVWVTTRRVDPLLSSTPQETAGTRTREREFLHNPDEFKRLGTGEAIVIEPAAKLVDERVRVWRAEE